MKKPLKKKACKICLSLFEPRSSTAKVCSWKCAVKLNEDRKEKKLRKELLIRKRELKTKSQWLKEAQSAYNYYIRQRDFGRECISCGKQPLKKNAGHFRTTKAAPELRFHEDNCHLQCEHCNTYLSGNISSYRANLIKKIGLERVEFLEGKHEPKKYSIDDIKQIKSLYKQKVKDLTAQQEGR